MVYMIKEESVGDFGVVFDEINTAIDNKNFERANQLVNSLPEPEKTEQQERIQKTINEQAKASRRFA